MVVAAVTVVDDGEVLVDLQPLQRSREILEQAEEAADLWTAKVRPSQVRRELTDELTASMRRVSEP